MFAVEMRGGFDVEFSRGDLNHICSLSAPRAFFVAQTAIALHARMIVFICAIAIRVSIYMAQSCHAKLMDLGWNILSYGLCIYFIIHGRVIE